MFCHRSSAPATATHTRTHSTKKLTVGCRFQVKLRFTPPAKHRSGRVVDAALIFGELQVTFANEEEQMVG